MINNSELIEMIDWEKIIEMDRYAGGHDDQMRGLIKGATVLSHWNEGDYQGRVATMIKLESGEVVAYSDYYGSCSGCDSWEYADDASVIRMCIQLASTAKIFKNIDEAKGFLEKRREEGKDFDFDDEVRKELLKGLII